MNPFTLPSRHAQLVLNSLLLAGGYLLAAKIGLTFGTDGNNGTIFWPAGGIGLAALLLGGLAYLPTVFIGAFLGAHLAGDPLSISLSTAIGNALESLTGYYLLTYRAPISLKLEQVQDFFRLVLFGALIPSIISALIGALSFFAVGFFPDSMLETVIFRWWRGDVIGIVFLTPIILVFSQHRLCIGCIAQKAELVVLVVLSFLIGQMVFLNWNLPTPTQALPAPVWVAPLVIWSGLRAGRRITASIQLMLFSQALFGIHQQAGNYQQYYLKSGMENFWLFGMALAITGMVLAIISAEKQLALKKVTLASKVFAVSSDGITITDRDNNIIAVNRAFTEITGYSESEVLGKNPRLLASGIQDQAFYTAMWETLKITGRWEGEIWNRAKDGRIYAEWLALHTVKDEHGQVVNRIGIFSDITRRKAMEEFTTHQAQHDFLTNLPNRVLLYDRLTSQLALSKRNGSKFALLFIDLDKFKPINDTLGHKAGDQLLQQVAKRLLEQVRETDTVSRLGGDEFVILVSEVTSLEGVESLAQKVLSALDAPYSVAGYQVSISASAGIALYPIHGNDPDELLAHADNAMYRAKAERKNQ